MRARGIGGLVLALCAGAFACNEERTLSAEEQLLADPSVVEASALEGGWIVSLSLEGAVLDEFEAEPVTDACTWALVGGARTVVLSAGWLVPGVVCDVGECEGAEPSAECGPAAERPYGRLGGLLSADVFDADGRALEGCRLIRPDPLVCGNEPLTFERGDERVTRIEAWAILACEGGEEDVPSSCFSVIATR